MFLKICASLKNAYFEEHLRTTASEKLFFLVRLSHYCEFKVEHVFPNESFSQPSFDHHHALPSAFEVVQTLVILFQLQLLSVDVLLQVLKKNNTDGLCIHMF